MILDDYRDDYRREALPYLRRSYATMIINGTLQPQMPAKSWEHT